MHCLSVLSLFIVNVQQLHMVLCVMADQNDQETFF